MISKPKFKIARRLGAGVYDKTQTPKFAGAREKGVRGGRPKALSEYGNQLIEKQRVRYSYGLSERQLQNYVRGATHRGGAGVTDKLYERLEYRLDNVVYRMGLAPSRRGARQMVSHGHFTVNGERVTIPSYEVKEGDVVGVREGSKSRKLWGGLAEKFKDFTAPAWVSFDPEKLEGKVLAKPKNTESFFDLNAVLEFYSR